MIGRVSHREFQVNSFFFFKLIVLIGDKGWSGWKRKLNCFYSNELLLSICTFPSNGLSNDKLSKKLDWSQAEPYFILRKLTGTITNVFKDINKSF